MDRISGEAMRLISILALTVLTISSYASAENKTEVFSGKDLTSQFATLLQTAKASGSSGATLGDYKSHAIKLSVRTASGGAEVHTLYDDIFVVTAGKATLVTGGTVIDPKGEIDGETKGSGIQNGESQAIVQGDIVHIPAGTPHQLIIAAGGTFGAIVVKVKEAP
jgi:mannose-6-phosphate isomerase-like protein (cupin superfamily)